MRWRDEAIILSRKVLGESYLILETFCKTKGRCVAGVRGGNSRRYRPLLQLGNHVEVVYSRRSETGLGYFSVEPLTYFSGEIMQSEIAISYLQLIVGYLRYLPEEQPSGILYSFLLSSLAFASNRNEVGELLARFEIKLLQELGAGLALDKCALTGSEENLYYVSPKTGAAVTKDRGAPWAAKLFILPPFLLNVKQRPRTGAELAQAFQITEHFLERYLQQNHEAKLPEIRANLISSLTDNVILV